METKIPDINEFEEDQITTVVAEDLEIKGTIKFKSSVMLKGVFEGEIYSEGLLVVGPTAKVSATINTKTLISHGEISGNVEATDQIVLKKTSTHNGDLKSPFLMIENGAVFNGSCMMKRAGSSATISPVETNYEAQEENLREESDEPSYSDGAEENKETGDIN